MDKNTNATAVKQIQPDVVTMYFLGFKEKEGDYSIQDEKTGRVNSGHYHNIVLSLAEPYAMTEKDRIGFVGLETTTYKIKADMFPSVLGIQGTFNPVALADWLFQPVTVLYDKRGNVCSLRRVTDKPVIVEVGNIES